MNRLYIFITALLLNCQVCLADKPAVELIDVRKIWDVAPHSAFTDLIRWHDQFVCAFREGRGHVSSDGKIRVLTSKDGREWKSAALVSLDGYDLRDAGLSETPDGRLMLIGGASPRRSDGENAPTGSFVSFSDDAKSWTTPTIVSEPGRWLWRVTWHDGKTYGISYSAGDKNTTSALVASKDGLKFEPHVAKLLPGSPGVRPTEAVIRFAPDGTMYCLQRRDGPQPANVATLGVSKPPYRDWQWTDLGMFFGGPNFIELPNGRWIAAGRLMDSDGPHTHLAWLDVENKTLEPILKFPSGGDTSYPGLLWHDDTLWVSYYSSHEGKARIYLAKVRVREGLGARDWGLPKSEPLAPIPQPHLVERLEIDEAALAKLEKKPLYKFTEAEVDAYLRHLVASEPDLRKRIVHLARKNIGQPYELYLLGEMPFEPYDPQPIYCLGKSDCLVFTEHTYAMALSHNWPSFMRMLQRLRYRDGQLGVVTRNHYTEADWNISNNWLVEDITESLAGDTAVKFKQAIDRSKFFKNRYKLAVDIPVENHVDSYLPFEQIERAKSELQDGDFVNIVRGSPSKEKPDAEQSEIYGGSAWVGHVGLIGRGKDGTVNLIHSTVPRVREEPIDEYIARSTEDMAEKDKAGKPRLLGFKFLRLRDKPLENLKKVDGADAPRVTLPSGEDARL